MDNVNYLSLSFIPSTNTHFHVLCLRHPFWYHGRYCGQKRKSGTLPPPSHSPPTLKLEYKVQFGLKEFGNKFIMTRNVIWLQMSCGFQEGNATSSCEFSDISQTRCLVDYNLKDEPGDRKTWDLLRDH